MVNVFEFDDYRTFLEALVKERSAHGKTRAELAKAMGCQAAYLSQVLKGSAALTEDHGIRLCPFLAMSPLETEYFLVILRMGRAGSVVLRDYLDEQRKKLHSAYQKVESRVPGGKLSDPTERNIYYCSSWVPGAIHVATSCAPFQTVAAISVRLGLDKETVQTHLETLEKYGFVRFDSGRWFYEGKSIHFAQNSTLEGAFQTSRRMLLLKSLANRRKNNLHYAAIFAADQKTIAKFRKQMLELIESFAKEIEPSPSKEVFGICLDLFEA